VTSPSVSRAAQKPPRKGRTGSLAIAVGGCFLDAIVAVLATTQVAVIRVSEIAETSWDGLCLTNELTAPGFTTRDGDSVSYSLNVTHPLPAACTFSTVASSTPGFVVDASNLPWTIRGGGAENPFLTITPVTASFAGILTVDLE